MRCLKQSDSLKQKVNGGYQGLLRGRKGELLFSGYRISDFSRWEGSEDLFHNNINILNALNCVLTNGKLCYVFLPPKKKILVVEKT